MKYSLYVSDPSQHNTLLFMYFSRIKNDRRDLLQFSSWFNFSELLLIKFRLYVLVL